MLLNSREFKFLNKIIEMSTTIIIINLPMVGKLQSIYYSFFNIHKLKLFK